MDTSDRGVCWLLIHQRLVTLSAVALFVGCGKREKQKNETGQSPEKFSE